MTDPDSDSGFSGQWWQVGPEQRENLTDFDVVLMRKDPPFDMEYIYSTYVLDSAVQAGTLVVNRPQSLRDCNEKYFTTQFSELMPPTIVSQRADALREFHAQHDDVIFKKLDGMGGMSVFRVRKDDPNLNVVIETLTDNGRSPIMGQKFVPEISQGDKRILLVDGNPVPYAPGAHTDERRNARQSRRWLQPALRKPLTRPRLAYRERHRRRIASTGV